MDRGFIDLMIISAADIKRGSLFGADKKIAVVWVDSNRKDRTKPAEGVNPVWNERLKVQLGDASRSLTIEIRSKGGFVGDTILGTVHIPVAEIAMDGKKEANRRSTYLVEQPSGKTHGSLTLIAKIVNSQSNAAHPPPVILPLHEKYSSYPPAQSNLPEKFSFYPPPQTNLSENFSSYPPAQSNLPDKFSYYSPAQTNLSDSFSSYPPAQINLPEKFIPYPPSQTYEPSAPLAYPPVEDYLAGQYQAARPYPPTESCYPPPYPPSQSAPDTMQPTYPAYEPVSDLPPSWRPSEYSYASDYSYAASHDDCYRPTPYPPPASHEYPVTTYPPAAPYYPPVQYPPPQYYSYPPQYPPLHEPYSCSYSDYN